SRMSVLSVSILAIINGKVAFFAPETGITPLSRCPPLIRMRSMPLPLLRQTPALPRRPCGNRRAAPRRHLALGPSLAANSGGIVGRGAEPAGGSRPALRLRLAALEVLPQRRAQTPLLPDLRRALGIVVHRLKIR